MSGDQGGRIRLHCGQQGLLGRQELVMCDRAAPEAVHHFMRSPQVLGENCQGPRSGHRRIERLWGHQTTSFHRGPACCRWCDSSLTLRRRRAGPGKQAPEPPKAAMGDWVGSRLASLVRIVILVVPLVVELVQ